MKIALIVAIAENNAIGKNNELLWHLPADLKRFKEITTGHHIIMGRKTFESIGKPLPNRTSIVISRNSDYQPEGVQVVHSLRAAFELCKDEEEVFIIGGGAIYKETLHLADRIYLTKVHQDFTADTFFPPIEWENWNITKKESLPIDEKNKYPATFMILDKIKNTMTTLEQINTMCKNTLVSHLGMEFISLENEELTVSMPVDERTRQPMGYLHGGASLALLETVGSGLSTLLTDLTKFDVFGMNANANHLKPVKKGKVYAKAYYIHKGSKTQIVGVQIRNEANELICDGRITNIIIPKQI